MPLVKLLQLPSVSARIEKGRITALEECRGQDVFDVIPHFIIAKDIVKLPYRRNMDVVNDEEPSLPDPLVKEIVIQMSERKSMRPVNQDKIQRPCETVARNGELGWTDYKIDPVLPKMWDVLNLLQ
jgi:hypothetical protein